MDFLQTWADNLLRGELELRNSERFIEADDEEKERLLYDYQISCDLQFEEKCKEIIFRKLVSEEEKQRQDEYITALICSGELIRKEHIEGSKELLLEQVKKIEYLYPTISNVVLKSCVGMIKVIAESLCK